MQFWRQAYPIPGIIFPVFVIVATRGPENIANARPGQVKLFVQQFMRAGAWNINPQILENLSRRMLLALLIVDELALRDAAFLADAGGAPELAHQFFWHESLGPAEGQVKDLLSRRTGIPERDFAVAFGVQLGVCQEFRVNS